MSPWRSSKTKLEAVQAFRHADQRHDSRYAPQAEPEDPPDRAFAPVRPGEGQNSSYYGGWQPQPPMSAQGYYANPTPALPYPGYHQSPQAPTQSLGTQQQYGSPQQGYESQQQGYSNPQQPSSPPQGQASFAPLNADGSSYQSNQGYHNNSNYEPPPALIASPEAGFQSSPPTHSSPEPPQQAHTRLPQRSLTYDNPYEQPFAPPQRIQTEPPQVAPHNCYEHGLGILGKCTRCGYREW